MRFPKKTTKNRRSGATVVEFAIVTPFVFATFFTAFEFSRVAMIGNTAANAAYEGARQAIIPGGTAAQARARASDLMNVIGVNNANVTVQPTTITDDTRDVTVRISVSLETNTFVPLQFFGGKTIDRELTMRREGKR